MADEPEQINPYASPQAMDDPDGAYSEDEKTRRAYIERETSIKSLGKLYLVGSLLTLLGAFSGLSDTLAVVGSRPGLLTWSALFVMLGLLGVAFGLAVFFWWIYRGLRDLRPAVRLPAIVLSVIGLAGFPLLTLLNIFALSYLHGEKGRFVFSDEYKRIIKETPHIQAKTSPTLYLLLLLLIGFIAIVIYGMAFAPAGVF